MSREYRDLLVKAAPDDGAAAGGMIRGGSSGLARRVGMRAFGLAKAGKMGRGKRTLARLNGAQSFLLSRRKFGGRPDGSGLARIGRYF